MAAGLDRSAARRTSLVMVAAAASILGPALEARSARASPAEGAPMATHAEEVASYTLRARLDPEHHTVHGEGTLRWTNGSRVPVREVWIHLYLNAFKNQKSVFLREPVGGFRGTDPVREWGTIDVRTFALRGAAGRDEGATELWTGAELRRPGSEDETDARVPLPREVAPGETVEFAMSWDDTLPSIVERTGFLDRFHMVAQWFPKIALLSPSGEWAHFPFHHLAEFYADFGTYDVTLDVPEAFVLGATGVLQDERREGGRRIARYVQGDVHDFAWTAWDAFTRRCEHVDRLTSGDDGIDVCILHPPGYGYAAERELALVRFALPEFGRAYGAYPYRTLTLVHPPDRAREAGGMEYPTLITTGGPWFGPPGVRGLEDVTVHELGHQFFYGLVASDEEAWPFLDEGVNSYAEQRALAVGYGAGSLVDLAGLRVGVSSVHAMLAGRAVHDEPIAQAASAFATGAAYGSLVYSRTSALLETFRRAYGDETFTPTLGRYARAFRFRHPSPDDFVASMGEGLGMPAAQTLRRALFDEGWVNYKIVEASSHRTAPASGIFDGSTGRETVHAQADEGSYEGSVLVAREGTLAFPVDVELTREDGAHERVRWDGQGGEMRVPYRGPVPLRGAMIDPDRAVLIDQHPEDNFLRASGSRGGGAPHVLERVLYWAALFFQTIAP